MGGNPNPKQKLKPWYGDKAMAKTPLAIRVPVEVDEFVRALPNKTEWLRRVIQEAVEREKAAS